MKKPQSPCKECTERTEACWEGCVKWCEYKKKKDEYNAIVLENKKNALGIRVGKHIR